MCGSQGCLSLPLWEWKEVQEVLRGWRGLELTGFAKTADREPVSTKVSTNPAEPRLNPAGFAGDSNV